MRKILLILIASILLSSCIERPDVIVHNREPSVTHRFPDVVLGKVYYSNIEYVHNPLEGYSRVIDSMFFKFPTILEEHDYYLYWKQGEQPDTVHLIWNHDRFRRDNGLIYMENSLEELDPKTGKDAYVHFNWYNIGDVNLRKTNVLILY